MSRLFKIGKQKIPLSPELAVFKGEVMGTITAL